MGRLKHAWFRIDLEEVRVDRRGFQVQDPRARERIEQIGAAFLHGYHAALLVDEPLRLAERLAQTEAELVGFAYEGAAMGLALSDFFTPWQRRWSAFLQGPGDPHRYMMHVGLGWAFARLPVAIERRLVRLDPLLGWLAIDGYGFHQGYFHGRRFIDRQEPPKLWGYARCAFDQGLGRSLWFVQGADPERIAAAIAAFAEPRRYDLWSGVGLACAYAGGADEAALNLLRERAGRYLPQLAQGAAFAAKARQRAGNLAAHTELACRVLGDLSAQAAAALTDQALAMISPSEPLAYERWRRLIQARFAEPEYKYDLV
ncbi:DUF1702 family protein [Methylothermus subterraneus]